MGKKSYGSPYFVWMSIFIIVPMFLVLYYAFTIQTDQGMVFSLDNIKRIAEPLYIKVFVRSLVLALESTAICLLIAYPAAMILADKKFSKSTTFLVMIVLPMWMNFLLRTYSWLSLLENNGLINKLVISLGFERMQLMYNEGAVVLGMVYNFLPFMILPIYSVLVKIDNNVIEAARDLGCTSFGVFKKITVPLSLPGVLSGITMVFMPAISTFIISRLLSGGKVSLIGNVIEQQFLVLGDWGFGSALSLVLMVFILISMAFINKGSSGYEGGIL
ncbi:MAG: ABC transporter permease [Clostridia bacterium]|nr:ABC transporter permease [Clostridia bacterium]